MYNFTNNLIDLFSTEFSNYLKIPVSNSFDLGIGQVNIKIPDWYENYLNKIQIEKYGHSYGSPLGDVELISKYFFEKCEKNCESPNNSAKTIVTNGGKEALWLSFMLTVKPNSNILLPSPTWTPYYLWAKALSANIFFYDVLSPSLVHDISSALKSKKIDTLVINFPNNPTGIELPDSELEKLIFEAERNNITIISDEVYNFLSTSSSNSIFKFIKQSNNLFCVDSISKELALPGVRIGFISSNEVNSKNLTLLRSSCSSNVSTVSQRLAFLILNDSRISNFRAKIIKTIIQNQQHFLKLNLPGCNTISYGGMYGWVFLNSDINYFKSKDIKYSKGGEFLSENCYGRISFALESDNFNKIFTDVASLS